MRHVSKVVWGAIGTVAMVLMASATASAQVTATANITATATVAARARITLTGTINFPDTDPATASIDAAGLSVQVQARTTTSGAVNLTVIAGGDFVATGGTIPIANLSWSTTGAAGFLASGTMSSTTAQNVGAWTGPGARNGSQTYHLVNDWAYSPGNYSVTLTYTLTAP
jgi:hypothetical protein